MTRTGFPIHITDLLHRPEGDVDQRIEYPAIIAILLGLITAVYFYFSENGSDTHS